MALTLCTRNNVVISTMVWQFWGSGWVPQVAALGVILVFFAVVVVGAFEIRLFAYRRVGPDHETDGDSRLQSNGSELTDRRGLELESVICNSSTPGGSLDQHSRIAKIFRQPARPRRSAARRSTWKSPKKNSAFCSGRAVAARRRRCAASPDWKGPMRGEIEIAGKLVNSPARRVYVPTEKRDIGMVFNPTRSGRI